MDTQAKIKFIVVIKRNFCPSKIKGDFNLNNLKIHRCDKNMETEYPLAPYVEKQELLQNFTNFTSRRAKCKKCNYTFSHTALNTITDHLRNKSAEKCLNNDRIIEFENYIIEKEPLWKYIKLRRDSESNERYECVLCEGKIVNLNRDFLHHTHEDDDYSSRGKSYEDWQWKYCQLRKNNTTLICDVCNKEVKIICTWSNLEYHMKKNACDNSKLQKDKRREYITKLWEHFKRNLFDKVKCKTCNKMYQYMTMQKFDSHVEEVHKHISDFEKINPCNKSCRNLQRYDDLSYKCTMCQQQIPDTALLNHECKEDYNIVPPYDEKWKYKVRISDFLLKCAVCPHTFSIFTSCPLSHKCIPLVTKKRTINMERQTDTITGTVWEHFEKESNTRAICKHCDLNSRRSFKYVYIERTSFLLHVESHHSEIFKLETHKKDKFIRRWKYVKYVMGINSCVLCSEVIESRDDFDNHMHDNDFPLFMLENYEDWPWKYCLTFHDSRVFCDICREMIEIEYDTSAMEDHLKKVHSITLQQDVGIKNTAGSSCLAGIQQQGIRTEDAADSSFLASTQQQEVGIEDTAVPSSIADLQQQEAHMEDTADTSSLPGTSGSQSLPKKQKKDSPSEFWRQWE